MLLLGVIACHRASGQRRNPAKHPAHFTTAYFHRPDELAGENREAGFEMARILAVEGPAWSAVRFQETWADPTQRGRLMGFLSLIEEEPSIQGASARLMAVDHSLPRR